MGICNPHGIDPKKPAPKRFEFEPRHITLIQIFSDRDTLITTNHASFALPKTSKGNPACDDLRLSRALDLFELTQTRSGPKAKFSSLQGENAPYKNVDYDDFEPRVIKGNTLFPSLSAATQHEIFIHIDLPGVALDDEKLISFTPLSAKGEKRNQNFSFFAASSVASGSQRKLRGKIIRLRNYLTDKNGDMIGKGQPTELQIYALNIHFLIKGLSGNAIPVIVDPDTGNGMGGVP